MNGLISAFMRLDFFRKVGKKYMVKVYALHFQEIMKVLGLQKEFLVTYFFFRKKLKRKMKNFILMIRITENAVFESCGYPSEYFRDFNLDGSFLNSVPLKLHFQHFFRRNDYRFCLQRKKVVSEFYAYPLRYFSELKT